ncbi:hypothetical protein AVEN_52328-1 [Araneus ventricosus]|uniref:Uncharacterized protein n=1 Tax=Araneus ventricosus TaxID=182803 RepID=A0A4Y2MSE2_ARAVE|nr:hypothetical protein AVEN_52328-1 [Araneus ventricosus]
MMSTSDYMVESTAYSFHLDPHRSTSIHFDPHHRSTPRSISTQRIRRPFIYANIIQKMTSWKCPPCGAGILRDFISLTARPIISNTPSRYVPVISDIQKHLGIWKAPSSELFLPERLLL